MTSASTRRMLFVDEVHTDEAKPWVSPTAQKHNPRLGTEVQPKLAQARHETRQNHELALNGVLQDSPSAGVFVNSVIGAEVGPEGRRVHAQKNTTKGWGVLAALVCIRPMFCCFVVLRFTACVRARGNLPVAPVYPQ